MFFLIHTVSSLEACTTIPIIPLSFGITEASVSESGRFDFYTIHQAGKDSIKVKAIIINSTEKLTIGKGNNMQCPSVGDAKDTIEPGTTFQQTFKVNSELGFTTFSVFGAPGTKFVISTNGNNPNNYDNKNWETMSIIYLILSIVYMIVMFIHSVLSRSKVHYEVDVSEN